MVPSCPPSFTFLTFHFREIVNRSPVREAMRTSMTALFLVLVSASWPEPAHGAGSGARPAAAAVADRSEAATASPALELLRVGERDAVISFHMPRLPGRPPATHFQLRVAAGGGLGEEELRKIAVKAGADCAAADGCKVAAYALHTTYLRCACTANALQMHCLYTLCFAVRRRSSGYSRAHGTSSRSPLWRGEEAAIRRRRRRRLWGITRHLWRSLPSHPPPHRPSSRPPQPPLLPLPPLFCRIPPPRAKARP